MVEKGSSLDKAIAWAAEGIELVRKQDESSKPPSSAVSEWKKTQANTLASLLNTRGMAFSKLGKVADAEADFVEAYLLSKGADLPVNSNLIDAYLANEKFAKAAEVGLNCIRKGKSNLTIVGKFKTAYVKVHGSLAGYDNAVQQAKAAEQTQSLKSGLNKPAPDFSLRDINGATVKLSDLRGKVVVLGFWASWNGASRALFPHLQKVFEAYQYYRTVAFLAINTSEDATGAARDSLVKKLMTGLKCSIPVVGDEGSVLAEKYEMEGIPTMYVIDRNGKIQFKHAGFNNGHELVNELTGQIEVLLKH
jgi:peroxiredoxin